MHQQRTLLCGADTPWSHVLTRVSYKFSYRPVEFSTVEIVDVMVRAVRKQRKSAPMGLEMGRAKQAGNKSLVNVIDEEQEFNFHPYAFTPRETATFHLFDLHNQDIVPYQLRMHWLRWPWR